MPRPRKQIDADQVMKLAAINCSYAEMAAVLDCDESTLTRRFAQVIKKGRLTGNMSLKRKQWELAMAGDKTMLIWLGKQNLGQAEKLEQTGAGGGPQVILTMAANGSEAANAANDSKQN